MDQQPPIQDPEALTYLELRKAVGIIGCALPFVLAFGKILTGFPGIQGSISCYYYTDMRNIFVGSLCAIGVFLISCRGYDLKDELAGYLAGSCAIGVALCRTSPCPGDTDLIGILHLVFATVLFLTLAYFCLKLFTLNATDLVDHPITRRKLQRNNVYRVCGWTILSCIALIAIVNIPSVKTLVESLTPVFWLESLAIIAFGFAWLIKGETFLKDE